MNRLLFIVFAFIISLHPVIAQGSIEDNMYIKRMREEYERRQKQQNNFQKPMDDSVLTLLGRWAWGACGGVDIHLPYAYIGNGSLIQILDISNPETPAIIGEYLTGGGSVDELIVKDNYLYAQAGGYLYILDISNPYQPSLLGSVSTHGWFLAVTDSFAYTATWGCYLQIIDISNPSNPYLRGGCNFVGMEFPSNITVHGKTVYANGDQMQGFSIIDITNPDNPTSYTYALETYISNLTVCDTLLLVSTNNDSFLVYSVKDRFNPVRLGGAKLLTQGGIFKMAVNQNHVYATAARGVYTFDISEQSNPKLSGYFSTNNLSHYYGFINYDNGKLITGVLSGMMLIDAENPDSLKQINYFAMAESFYNIKIKEKYAIVCCGLSGLWIIDISDPYNFKPISNVNIESGVSDVVIDSNYAFAIARNGYIYNHLYDTTSGIYIVDISDMSNPFIVSRYKSIIKNTYNRIKKFRNYLFITQNNSEYAQTDSILEIINVSNVHDPVNLGIYRNNVKPLDIEVTDSLIYLTTNDYSKMYVLNYSNPAQIKLVSVFQKRPFDIMGIIVNDTLIYAHCFDTVFVLNCSNPINIFSIGHTEPFPYNYYIVNMHRDGNYVYWGGGKLGIVDVSDPYHPYQRMIHIGIESVTTKDDVLLVIYGEGGIVSFRNNLVNIKDNEMPKKNKFFLFQNYPNPFNSSTTISYVLPNNEVVELNIYNVLGKELITLQKGMQSKGIHSIQWNGKDKYGNQAASGIYLCKLTVKGKMDVKKLIFLK